MKKSLKIFLGILLVILTIFYTYYVKAIVDDELFNYGFAQNILNGLVPYRDFNMIIPPLFSYTLALFLAICGKKLIVYHLVLALIIVMVTWFSYKKIGNRAIIIYLLLLIYPYTGYNMFSLLLMFLLFYVIDKGRDSDENYEIVEAIIISMMVLTKQTLGLLIIPSLIFARHKKKVIGVYLVFILAFLGYLILNDNLVEFIDYCFLGMFDFTNKNGTSFGFLFVVEIIILGVLGYFAIRTKRKELFYCLCFQIITFPIVDYVHFMISFIPVFYLFLFHYKNNPYVFLFTMTTSVFFFVTLNVFSFIQNDNYLYLTHYKVDNFMKGRVTYRVTSDYVFNVKKYLDEYEGYTPYILGHFSYLIKLNNDLPINKFDIINNGNMGYNGKERYLKEIDDHCKRHKCIFVINDGEATISKTIQTNREILQYVKDNYYQRYSSNIFSVYTN